jgi:hypothetical protein
MIMKQDMFSRRSFLRTASVAATAVTLIPRHVLGQGQTPPSQKLNVAGIGIGGMGAGDVAFMRPSRREHCRPLRSR